MQRQALAGLVWSKQLFYFDVNLWLDGDPGQPPPPESRKHGRNREWGHVNAIDVMSMPDVWEYPWFAAWDLAFHCLPFALIDPDFAKHQLLLLGCEWYQHPNGQVPAYEWAFGDVNPPVVAWAAWRVYKIDQRRSGIADREFLERVFHKQLMNFTWWVNRKDSEGNNVFEGGFLGLDNIGVFDRSAPLPTGGHIKQSDGTSWMGMFCLNMMTIALELATENRVYEDIATKFFEYFLYIAQAMNEIGPSGISLWNEEDEFFYDVLHASGGRSMPMKIRSMVGLIPLFGGNSNWRGPIWFPVNYLIVESLQQYHHYYGDDFKVECPTGSGRFLTLNEIATELSERLTSIFLLDEHGRRPVLGDVEQFQRDPRWRDQIPFYEYFHGDNGRGVGASHQTGWTALVAKLLDTTGCWRGSEHGMVSDLSGSRRALRHSRPP